MLHNLSDFQGLINPLGTPLCSFDPDGLIFAAGVDSKTVKLYDFRAFDKVQLSPLRVFCLCSHAFFPKALNEILNYLKIFPLKGPFACFETRFNRVCDWTGLKFSSDGKQILISTNKGIIGVLNAFNGSVLHTFSVRDILEQKYGIASVFMLV